ncbi:MAG: phosphate signaling complex protein PhoU [Gemmatimonadota bacterium]
MTQRFHEQLDELKQKLLAMSYDVEGLVERAVALALGKSDETPDDILGDDADVDATEVEVEESCIELLALHQPMATDLRVLVAILKINSDLERVGDHAGNIAGCIRRLRSAGSNPPIPPELEEMGHLAREMLRDALDAFVRLDAETANELGARDDRVDALEDSIFRIMLTHMPEHDISACLQVLLIARNIERIADLATNIGEDVVYMVHGRTVRHGAGQNL